MEENTQSFIEVEAATVEEAIKKALKTLKAKKRDVNIQVLNEGKRGLFGIEGETPAKIKATLTSLKK